MNQIFIKNLEELKSLDLSNYEVKKDIEVDIRFKVENESFVFPIKILHKQPNFSSKINIKLAVYGKSKVEIPAEILVAAGAKGTSTNFKALIYLMDKDAKATVTPGLLIHEKDIQSAGHGVVIKSIKDKDTFYIRSRGIKSVEAKELLVGI